MATVQQEALRLQRAGISDSTRVKYQSIWHNFETKSLNWGVVGSEAVYLYIASLSMEGKAPQTILTHCSALRFMFMESKGHFGAEGFVLTQMLKGIQRTGKVHRQELYVVSLDQVQKMFKLFPLLSKTRFEAVLFSAALTLLFFALCRAGEVAGTEHSLTRRDVEFRDNQVFLTFHSHKSLKRTGLPQLVRVPPSGYQADISHLLVYDRLRPATGPAAQYLVWRDGSPLTVRQITQMLARTKAVVFGAENPSLHAFRRGGVVFWYKCGAPEREIQTIGRWSGDSHLVYLSKSK